MVASEGLLILFSVVLYVPKVVNLHATDEGVEVAMANGTGAGVEAGGVRGGACQHASHSYRNYPKNTKVKELLLSPACIKLILHLTKYHLK